MKMSIILASLCSLLISCATLTGGGEQPQPTEASLDGGSPEIGAAQVASTDPAYSSPELTDSQAPAEAQAAAEQTAQVDTNHEQRAASELDAAAPGAGSDTFHASTTPGIEPAPVEEVPAVLPEKTGASWDQQASKEEHYEEPKMEKPSYKKSKKSFAKKSSKKKHIAKKEKKSKREIAKSSKKSKKSIAKNVKAKDCKKISKSSKKATQKAIAMCKADKKKMASKGKKLGKVASAGKNSSIR